MNVHDHVIVNDAKQHLIARSQRAFDACGSHSRLAWSVEDAHAARVVVYELRRLERGEPSGDLGKAR